VALAYETNNYVVNLATFSVDANPSQSQPFVQTAITTVGQLLVNTATGNIRQSFAITKGDFAGNGLQEVVVGFDSPLPAFPSFSQAQISIYGMQSGQLTAEGGAVVPTNPYYLSLAAGRVLRGPAATQGDNLVVATGYPTSQQVNVFSLTLSNGSFSPNQGYEYQTNSTGQFKSDLTDANIQVATGDLRANGGADIVVAQTDDENAGPNEDFAPVEVITLGSSPSDSSLYQLNSTAFCCSTGPNFSGQFSVAVSDVQPIDPNARFSTIAPQIVIAADVTNTTDSQCPYSDCLEVITYPPDLQGPGRPWRQNGLQFFPLAGQEETSYLPGSSEVSRTAFTLTDPNGDSLTLGPPTQHIVNGVAVPLVVLRAPPVHFDQFGTNTYDVNGCFGSNLGTCGFSSSFSDSQQSTFTTDVNQTDSWQASATVSGGVSYAGFDVEASLQGRYGMNFSNENNSSVNTQVTVQVNANVNDYVFFRKTDYVVLEYPIYGVGRTTVGQPDAYVAVITGVDTSYAFENTSPGSTVAPSLDNIHQQGNLLSYPYYFPSGTAEPSNSIDDNPEVSPSTNGASTTSTPFPSISIGQTGSASGQDSFANQTGQTISNTQTYGYTVTASVGYEQEGVPIKAKLEGSYQYDASNFQSQSSSFGSTMQLNWNTGSLNRAVPATNYTMRPYLYWNRAGALVLDWEVELPTSNNGVETFWQRMYGHQPDPALNLPDLLDTAKGYSTPQSGLQNLDPEMTFTTADPVPGGPLGVLTPVHNYSLKNTAPWPGVRYYLGDPAQGGIYLGDGSSACFSPGDCLPSQFTSVSRLDWTIPPGLGGRDIRVYASVDPGHSIPEIHYDNNTGWGFTQIFGRLARTADVFVSGSDISSSSAAPAPGSTIALRARVHAGSATGPVQVTFWSGNPATNGSIIATTQLGSIPSGGSAVTAPISWTVPKTQSQYSIFVQALPLDNFDTNMTNNSASTTLTSPALFVSDTAANAVSAYAGGASGNVAPMATLSHAATGLDGPRGVLVDSFGDLFVANSLNNSVTEYSEGSKGNTAPKATISGTKTKLSQPQGLAMDASGNICVSNEGNSSITEYRPGSNGNVNPIARISGAATKLSQPQGLALNAGRLYVANEANSSVTEYSQTAKGNAKPLATISGAATGLKSPVGLLFDSSGNLRVSNAAAGTITTYKPGATGNVKPISRISGKKTNLNGPGGMDVDGSGQIAVANTGGKSVTFFATGAKGNAPPSATISGSRTNLSAPAFVAFTPPPAATTGNAITVKKNTTTLTGIVNPTGSATVWYFAYKHAGSRTWSRSKNASPDPEAQKFRSSKK
jgi:hypothetical protein